MGAGMIALLGLIDTFKEEKELDPFKTFFQKFRQFGLRGFLISLLGLGSSIISVTDIFFFAKTTIGKWFIPLMVLLLIFGLAIMLNAWYFQVRNPQASFKDVFRISIYYGLRKWYVSCLNVFFTILNVCNDVFEATVWVCCNPCPVPRDYLFKYWEIA